MKLHHIGIIAKDINSKILMYSKLGYVLYGEVIIDDIQNNKIALLHSVSSPLIELIEPIDSSSSVYNFKEGYHHICYESEQKEDIIKVFRNMNIGKIFTKPIIAPALNNSKVVFACLQNGTFVEFIL